MKICFIKNDFMETLFGRSRHVPNELNGKNRIQI